MKMGLFLFLLIFLPTFNYAESLQVSAEVKLSFRIPEGWVRAEDPPVVLLEEMAEHIAGEASEKGYSPDRTQLLNAARKRLAANEVLLFNPKSRAYLTIDFSHLNQGEQTPGKELIRLSAKYAGDSLEHEGGVSHLKGSIREISIAGGGYSYRYDADYLLHDEPRHFSGIIGFVSPYWYFIYYTDLLTDPRDEERSEQLFKSLRMEKLR